MNNGISIYYKRWYMLTDEEMEDEKDLLDEEDEKDLLDEEDEKELLDETNKG